MLSTFKNRIHLFAFAINIFVNTAIGFATSVHEQIDEQESISSADSETIYEEISTKESDLLEVKELSFKYCKDIPDFKKILESTEPLTIIKNSDEKRALAFIQMPKENEIIALNQEEKELIKEFFQTYAIKQFGNKLIIAFSYQDENLLPGTKEQAIYLLLAAYTNLDDSEKAPSIDGILNEKQAKALKKKEYHPRPSNPLVNQKLEVKNLRAHEGLLGSTRVKTSTGYSTLQELQVGDMVACFDPESKQMLYSPITHTDRIEVQKHIRITIKGQDLRVAPEHLFHAAALNEWVPASALLDDANLCSYVDPDINDVQLVNEKLEVVRISVNSHHNFFITDNNILVHNYIPIVLEVVVAFEIGQEIAVTWAILAPTAMAIATGLWYWITDKFVSDTPRDLIFTPSSMQDYSDYISSDKADLSFHRNDSNQKPNQSSSGKNSSSNKPDKDPENERKDNEYITTKEATEAAEKLGFQKIREQSEGRPVYKKGNRYITPDRTRHNGGFWKMADSIEGLKSRQTRLGTFDILLNRIGN